MRAFAVESENSFEVYSRFLDLLSKGHTVFLCPSYQFRDQEFRDLLQRETQTDFVFCSRDGEVEESGSRLHPAIANATNQKKSCFIVRTSGSSSSKYKFILHDLSLFLEKYKKLGRRFSKTLAFFPFESIAGIETLLEAVEHDSQIVAVGDRLSPDQVTDLIDKESVDYFHTTPTFLNLMLISGQFQKPEKFRSLRSIAFGSEPPQDKVLSVIQEVLPRVELVQNYGMSEVGVLVTETRKTEPAFFRLNEKFNPARVVEGLLQVQSQTPLITYLNADTPFDGKWFNTFDRVQVENSYFRVLGRSGELVNLGGRKFFPSELEELLMGMDEVQDATVLVNSNEMIGSFLTAKVLVKKGTTEEQFRSLLKDFSESKIPYYMQPSRVEVVAELPTNPRSKKDRRV